MKNEIGETAKHLRICASCKELKQVHTYYDNLVKFGRDSLRWPQMQREKQIRLTQHGRWVVWCAWLRNAEFLWKKNTPLKVKRAAYAATRKLDGLARPSIQV